MNRQALIAAKEKADDIWYEAHSDHGPLSMIEGSAAEKYRQAKNGPDKALAAKLLVEAKQASKARVENGKKLEAAKRKVVELDRQIAAAKD